jgi:transposase-like protein
MATKRRYEVPGNLFCPNPECEDYGEIGKDNIIHHCSYGKNNTDLWKCKSCGKTFSENKGTPFFGLKTSKGEILQSIRCLVDGNGISATARIVKKKGDTILDWLRKMARHVEKVNVYLVRDLHLTDVQIDELWTFIKKKREM